jgi:hypothetical protein
MKKLLLLVSTLILSSVCIAQKQTDKWYFGQGCAIDFSTGTATVIPSGNPAYAPTEGCSTMSDASGNLLFYTDGMTVYDKTHSVMANGTGLDGGNSSTQAALIVPKPGSTSLYYIFTTDEFAGANGLKYSVVDMSLASGNGSVTVKNTSLMGYMCEKVTAVKDPFNARYWILAHQWGTADFYAYSLTASGVSAPVISSIGTVHTGTPQNTYGQMKFNPCGNKVALTIGYTDVWELASFNTNSGVVSNLATFPEFYHVYGIEFSPDASRIYVSTYNPNKTLVQYDITPTNTNVIASSQATLSTTGSTYGMQLASDGKIYVVKSFSQFLGVIDSPNLLGLACNYNDMGFDVDPNFLGNLATLSTPGFVQSYFLPVGFNCPVPQGVADIKVETVLPVVYPNPSSNSFSLLVKERSTVEIYDAKGRLIERSDAQPGTFSFGEKYASGVYFLKMFNEKEISSTRIVKD